MTAMHARARANPPCTRVSALHLRVGNEVPLGRTGQGALQAEVAQPGMILGPRARGAPPVLALGLEDRQVVDRGDAPAHQTALVELPVLVAVGAEPVTRIVVPLVGEAHPDPILAEGPDLLDEPVVELATPLAAQERLDLGASVQKLGPISPHRVLGVGERDPLRVAGVPGVLGHPHLGDCALPGERRLDRGSGRGSGCGLAHAVLSPGCAVSRTRLTSAPASASSAARSSAKFEPAVPQTRNRMATNAAPRLGPRSRAAPSIPPAAPLRWRGADTM